MDRKAVLPASDLGRLVDVLQEQYEVYGPVPKGERVVFGRVTDPSMLRLDYVTTILPPKKLFCPPVQTLFRFDREQGVIEDQAQPQRPRALFGVHPCDVAALGLLDRVLDGGDFKDPEYREKRNQTLVVALNCSRPGPYCFCTSFGTGPAANAGFDLALTALDGRYLIEAGTERGEELLRRLNLREAEPADVDEKAARVDAVRAAITRRIRTENLPATLDENFDHPVWEELKEACLSCGSCTAVCPTCYCFDVWDQVNLDLATGERKMCWDSCQLVDFARVAMGHNFRGDRAARIKQRVYHKLDYFTQQYGDFGCVGCGRCALACIKHIDLVEIAAQIGG